MTNPAPAPAPSTGPNLVGFDGKIPAVTPVAPPAKAAEPAAPKEATYEIDFKGQKVSLTAAQIASLQEKARQFDTTAKQKAELEKGLAALIAKIDEDPLGVYEARGKDRKKLVAEHFKKMIEEDQQDPTQRELAQLRAERDARVKKDADVKKAQDDADALTKRREMYTALLKDMDAEMTKRSLPKDQYTIDRMLRIMAAGKRSRGQVFSVAEAAEIVEREEVRHLGFIAKQLPSERLKTIFGPDIIKKLNSEQVAELKKADVVVKKENAAAATTAKKQTEDEKKKFRREFNGI